MTWVLDCRLYAQWVNSVVSIVIISTFCDFYMFDHSPLAASTTLWRGICSLRGSWCSHSTYVQVRWSLAYKHMIISPCLWVISIVTIIHISVPSTIFPVCPLLQNVDVAMTAFNFYALDLSLPFLLLFITFCYFSFVPWKWHNLYLFFFSIFTYKNVIYVY